MNALMNKWVWLYAIAFAVVYGLMKFAVPWHLIAQSLH